MDTDGAKKLPTFSDEDLVSYIAQGANLKDLYAAGYTEEQATKAGYKKSWSDGQDKRDFNRTLDLKDVSPENIPLIATPQDWIVGKNELGGTIYQTPSGDQYTISDNPNKQVEKKSVVKATVKGLGDWFQNPSINPEKIKEAAKGVAESIYRPIENLTTGQGTYNDLIDTIGLVAGTSAPKAFAGGLDKNTTGIFFSAPKDLAQEGQKLLDAGFSREEVARKIGIWQNPKTKDWLSETDDSKAYIIPDSSRLTDNSRFIGDIGDLYSHKELFSLFPEITKKQMSIYTGKGADDFIGKDALGSYDLDKKELKLRAGSEEEKTAIHELQHAVDNFQQRDSGANPDEVLHDFKIVYDNLPNEGKTYLSIINAIPDLEKQKQDLLKLKSDLGSKKYLYHDNGLLTREEIESGIDNTTIYLETLKKERNSLKKQLSDLAVPVENLHKTVRSVVLDSTLAYKTYLKNEGESLANKTMDRKNLGAMDRLLNDPWKNNEEKTWTQDEYKKALRDIENGISAKDPNSYYNQLLNLNTKKFAEGGAVENVDPVSGNKVPPGSLPSEVRDNVDIKASEGEYMLPADVVRYFGLDYIEKLVNKAKEGMQSLQDNGRIGGKSSSDLPFSPEELVAHEQEMSSPDTSSQPSQMAVGGYVQPNTGIINTPIASSVTPATVLPNTVTPQITPQKVAFGNQNPNEGAGRDQKEATGYGRSVSKWSPEDYTGYVNAQNDPVKALATKVFSMSPIASLALKAADKYTSSSAITHADEMLKSGVDQLGNPLSPEQKKSLQVARDNLAAKQESTTKEVGKSVGKGLGGGLGGLLGGLIGDALGKKGDKKSSAGEAKGSSNNSEKASSDKSKSDKSKNKYSKGGLISRR